MTIQIRPSLPFSALLFTLLLGGCVAAPAPEKTEDPQLNQLLSAMDKSLANQAAVNSQLQEQQRQLEQQQQNLDALTIGIEKAVQAPPEKVCPKAKACPPPSETSGKIVVGGLEQVWLSDLGFALTARIDTGAQTSSLDARNIELFERDGKSWVRFEIMNPETGEPEAVERTLRRKVGIVSAGSSKAKRRPVVKMSVVIGDIEQTAEFTLNDRSHLGYQALIGRSILKDVMVVDVSRKNLAPYIVPTEKTASPGAAK